MSSRRQPPSNLHRQNRARDDVVLTVRNPLLGHGKLYFGQSIARAAREKQSPKEQDGGWDRTKPRTWSILGMEWRDGVERWSDEWAKDGRGSDGLNNARGVTVERESKKPLCPSQRRRCEGGEEGREELSPAQYDRQTGGIVRVDLPPPAPSS